MATSGIEAKGGLRRRLMVMAAGVVGCVLIAEALALAAVDRLDRSLERLRVESLVDVRRVLTLAESASALSAFAHAVTDIHDRGELAIAERALDGRLEDFATQAAALPRDTGRPALPTLEPSIVRLADRFDGILRHLFAVTADAIERRGDVALSLADDDRFVDPRQRFLLAAVNVAATEMSGLVRNHASLIERSDRARAEAMAADLRLGKIAAVAIGAVALIAALILADVALRGVGADLLAIAEAMRRLATGDTSATAPKVRRSDEVGALAAAFDVFKRQAAERIEMEGRLRHTERLEAIGRLTGGIAHDFNNLLTAVSTNVQLIHDDAEPGSPTRTRALRALAAVERGSAMVAHLLAFGRRQALAPVATDVGRTIAALVDLVEASLRRDIALEVAIGEPDATALHALVDPGQLENALLNLVFNARDAIAGRGRITIGATATATGMIRLDVADDGVGMDEATLGRIFEPFFTTKPAGVGSGLGLSMVYGFVRQSGGRIEVSSRPGLGTTVTIELPAYAAPEDALPVPPPALAGPRRAAFDRGLKVLVVEDEAGVRAATVELLATLGHAATGVASAGEARARLAAGPAVDLVITDLALSGTETGADLVAALRAERPDLPALVVTGYVGDAEIDLPILPKPFRRDDLAAAIAHLFEGSEARPGTSG